MAQVNMKPEWHLKLTSDEFALIRRALGQRILDDEEWAQAEELDRRLATLQASASKSHADNMTKLFNNVQGGKR